MTYGENLKRTIEEGYIGTNNTCNGICTKCGECCGHILPIDQEDANKIQKYVFLHKIFPQKQMLIMQNKLQCPYYTGNREKGCSIYEARPKICKYYKCDKKTISIEESLSLKETMPVDMWQFALAIEREVRKSGTNKKARKTTNQNL